MASLSHLAVGIVAAKHCTPTDPHIQNQRWRIIFWMCLLSMLPDFDVITFVMGIPYEAPWGHRGAPHSLVFALGLALLFAPLLKQYFHMSYRRSFLLSFLVIASHGLLDTLTDGGHGVALFWPFSNERFFAPWQPIPVSPIGFAFLSERGLHVFLTELLYGIPFLVYGLWPPKKRKLQ